MASKPIKGTLRLIDNYHPPETKYFPIGGNEVGQFELREEEGFSTKAAADKYANEWRAYPKGSHARVLKIKGRYYVYVM